MTLQKGNIMAEKEMRNFALRDRTAMRSEFSRANHPARRPSKQPTEATRTSKLRERGTKKLHVFTGERVQVDKPRVLRPGWKDKIWKPIVKKVGVEKLEEV